MNTPDPQIYLASSSPRRQQLLEQINIKYILLHPDLKESPQKRESPVDYAIRNALEKARTGLDMLDNNTHHSQLSLPVLAADTVVSLDNKVFGKPANKSDGLNMLEQLSGKSHDVITAVSLVSKNQQRSALCKSTVTFREITKEEREKYWSTDEPHDKAGSYAIQGNAAIFIRNLSGSYSGVMGLPLFETASMLQDFGL